MHFPTILRFASRLRIVKRILRLPPCLLAPGFHSGMHRPHMSHSSDCTVQESQPVVHRLRLSPSPRLTYPEQISFTLKFIRRDYSHLSLATHSGILSSSRSIASLRYQVSRVSSMLLSTDGRYHPKVSVLCISPGHFRRRTSSPTSESITLLLNVSETLQGANILVVFRNSFRASYS